MHKEDILMAGHPVGDKIREIPQIITSDKKSLIPASAIPLNELFRADQMKRWHIDGLILKKIALQAVRLLARINEAGVCPGLISTGSLLVNPEHSGFPLYLTEPEHFQLLDLEQDYEWYPEDERIFPDTVLFDDDKQLLADNRLVLKILIGASRGNLKLPVKKNDQDHSWLFYQILPEDFRKRMEDNDPYSYEDLEELISGAIVLEEEHAAAREEKLEEGEIPLRRVPYDENRELLVLYMILRTEMHSPFSISRLMYFLMDEMEEECRMTGRRLKQAFIYGDGHVRVKEFADYPENFRLQFDTGITECQPSQIMIIGGEVWEGELAFAKNDEKEREYRCYLVLDGRIPNDRMFACALERLKKIREKGVRFAIRSSGEVSCEAVKGLESLTKEGGSSGEEKA